jgi:formylglycine-generating enzyme required for sulfatase activity
MVSAALLFAPAGCTLDEKGKSDDGTSSTGTAGGGGAGGPATATTTTTGGGMGGADASGGGGAGGTGGTGGTGGGASFPDCPDGMVDVGDYCVDRTEVTNTAYRAFLDAQPPTSEQVAECAWNTSYLPASGVPVSDARPVVRVDWCDAKAYCTWAGKHLCGKIGGGANDFTAFADAAQSEWYRACSNAVATIFPYGDEFDAATCNTLEGGGMSTGQVATYPECRGLDFPYDHVYDMSGNVWEWEDSCNASVGQDDSCRLRGGAFNSSFFDTTCSADYPYVRKAFAASIGFRCCADTLTDE